MTKKISKRETLPAFPKRKRVAAYARVSSGKDAMLNSLSSQINYYKQKIKSNYEWEFAGVYTDEAITGTDEQREEFQQLLKDCRHGKIDMVITKSISRFARNTLTLLKTVRELKAINIDVFFEEQNIHTLSEDGEMILTFLATFAQEESRSTSENMKWRINKDYEKGLIWGGNSCLGYKLKDKKLHLVSDEAEIVRLIYGLYIERFSDNEICRILESKGISPYKAKRWNRTTVMKILTNYNYTGDLLLQKTYRENHISKTQLTNKGELNKYIVNNAHEQIISKEVFNEAQKIRKSKTANHKKISTNISPFKGLIKCGKCDKAYTVKNSKNSMVWMCSTFRTKGKVFCHSKQVPNDKVKEAAINIFKTTEFDRRIFENEIESIIVFPENRLLFKMKNGKEKEYIWEYESRSKSWTDSMKEQAKKDRLKRKDGGNKL